MLVSTRTTNVLLVLMLAVGLGIVAMLATGVRGGPLDPPGAPASTDSVKLPGTPISGPTTIFAPGTYYLTRDITIGSGIAITINADAVTLNLNGFSLDGTDTAGSYGIHLAGSRTNVRITNGSISDMNIGLDAGDDDLVTIENVRITSNARGLQLGHASLVDDCMVVSNSETGIYITGDRSVVRDCSVILNLQGVTTSANSDVNTIERSTIVGNSSGDVVLSSIYNVLRNNRFTAVTIDGPWNSVVDNDCTDGTIHEVTPGSSYVPVAGTAHDNIRCTKS